MSRDLLPRVRRKLISNQLRHDGRVVAETLAQAFGVSALTNAPAIASALTAHPGVETILIGGRPDPEIGGAVDGRAVAECAAIVLEHDAPDEAVDTIEASGATVIRANPSA